MREILPGILTWTWFSEPHGYDFNGYLVRDPGGNLVVDPVPPATTASTRSRAPAWRPSCSPTATIRAPPTRCASDRRAHADARGRRRLRPRPGRRHRRGPHGRRTDRPFAVVAAAGKSPGEVALHWPQRRLLVVGDAVIGNPPGHCALLREKVMDDPAALRQSVRRLLDLDFDALLVGDGTPILEGAKARLAELVASFAA